MSKIEELIEKLCPNGVKFEKIENLTNFEQPTKYIVKSTKYNEEYTIPVLTAGQSFILGYTNEQNGIYNASKEKPVIIFDDFTGAFKWVDFPFKVKSSAIKIITAKDNKTTIRYLYHMMGVLKFYSNEHKRLWISVYSQFKVAVPPLEVQCEIVRILDKFTELEVELETKLEAELESRKKQYEYYRNKLLNFDDTANPCGCTHTHTHTHTHGYFYKRKIEYFKLKDIAEIGTGSSNTNEELENGKYPFFVRSPIVRYKNDYEYDEKAIITSGDGVGVGKIFHLINGKYALHQRAYRIHITNVEFKTEFIYYYMKAKFYKYIKEKSFHSSVTSIRRPMLEDFFIPKISIEEQERIVKILDKFEKICNDILERLPVEIDARRKQYEYYRDKLLAFEEEKNDG